MSWLTRIIAPGQPASASAIAVRDGGSRLFVGSSSRSRFFCPATSWASASFVFSPPESVPASWNAIVAREARTSRAARAAAGRPRATGAHVRRGRHALAGCPRAPARSSRARRRARAERAVVGLGLSREDAEQAGLARAVQAHDQQALARAPGRTRCRRRPADRRRTSPGRSTNSTTLAAMRWLREPELHRSARAPDPRPASPRSFSTRVSSVLAFRARFAVWPRIESASVLSRVISFSCRAASGRRRLSSLALAPSGTASTCPGTRRPRRDRGAGSG